MPLLYPRATSPFDPPTTLGHLLSGPLQFLVRHLYAITLFLRGPAYSPPTYRQSVRVVCISDTHCLTDSVPNGDLLVHAGDLTNAGTADEIQTQIDWLKSLPHLHKLAIAGNHDSFLDTQARRTQDAARSLDWGTIHYLERSATTLEFSGKNRVLNVYGAPQIPKCGGADFAFQYERHEDNWSGTVPPETDILITHTPPAHHLDLPAGLGCRFLLKEIWRVRPTLHVFGHVHAGYGHESVFWDEGQKAYERVCAVERGPVVALLDPWVWLDVLRVVWYGGKGFLWNRVWGGSSSGGVLVNAALAYQNTGRLGNPVQVVDV
ncbi:MAG: hypothetical protein M1832_004159 [Thelocarpon impressellum]|nr:MAG: hypothetical protein M1832_004159 [Thelocarpon impressellum]